MAWGVSPKIFSNGGAKAELGYTPGEKSGDATKSRSCHWVRSPSLHFGIYNVTALRLFSFAPYKSFHARTYGITEEGALDDGD